jgi:hypothetical protein
MSPLRVKQAVEELAPAMDQTAIQTAITDKPAFRTDIGAMADTNAAVNTAIAGNPGATRAALETTSSTALIVEDFTDNVRWPDGTTITNNVTMPLVGTDPFWLNSTSSPPPDISNRGYGTDSTNTSNLWYLGSTVPTSGGKMSLGFQFELRTNPTNVSSFNNLFNISYSNVAMQDPSTGSIYNPNTIQQVHINFSRLGIQSAAFYGGDALTCLNSTYNGTVLPWITGKTLLLPLDKPFSVLLKVDGDYLTITIPGFASLVFYHADLSTRIGSEKTYFWFEDGRKNDNISMGFLRKIWGGTHSHLDSDPAWGGFVGGAIPDLNSANYNILPGTIISNPSNQNITSNVTSGANGLLTAFTMPNVGYAFKGGAASSTNSIANGGNVIIDGGFYANTNYVTSGSQQIGKAPMITEAPAFGTAKSSLAGAETSLHVSKRTQALALYDSEIWDAYGQLVGVAAKQLRVRTSVYNEVLFDSNSSGTPLDAIEGPYHLQIRRLYMTGAGTTIYATMYLPNGTIIGPNRVANVRTTENSNLDFRSTTVAAGGITMDGCVHRIESVSIR